MPTKLNDNGGFRFPAGGGETTFGGPDQLTRVAAHLERDRMQNESAEKMRESEEKYRNLFNTILEGFCIIEMIFDENGEAVDYRFLEINPAFEQQTGLHAAQGKTMREFAPDHEAYWFEIYGKIALTGEPAQFEREAKSLNRWYNVSAYRVGEAESRKVAVLFYEITSKKRAEEALRQSKERHDFIMDAAELGFWFCDLPFDELNWDTRVKAHFWLPPDAPVTIETFYQCLHPDDRERTRQAISESIANHTRYEIDYRTVSPSAQVKWIRAIGRTFYDSEGQPRRFDGLTFDVTQRKQAEALLRQNEALFSALVNQAPTGVYVVDAQFRLQQANALAMPAFEKVPGPIGRDFSEVMQILWGQEIGGKITGIFRHTLATGERYVSPRFSELRQDLGVEKSYEWETQRVTLPDGQHGVVCYFNDITERMEEEARERKLRALLADKSAHLEMLVQERTAKLLDTVGELEAFSYSIAHDMRAPLRSLQGFAGILLSDHGDKLDPECQRYLGLIAKSANRMDWLIQDVLDYSRLIRGDYPLAVVDVEQLLREIVATYPQLGSAGVEIELRGPFPRVLGNEAMLTQTFANLMGNAVKFVSPGVKPQVEVWAESQADRVRICIRDNGIGIAADQHEKIFGIFQRVNKNYEGTGIGLAIVKKAVERLGGKVGLESEPGRGSTFWTELLLEQDKGASE